MTIGSSIRAATDVDDLGTADSLNGNTVRRSRDCNFHGKTRPADRCPISGTTAGGRHVLRCVAEAGTEVCGMPDERHPGRES